MSRLERRATMAATAALGCNGMCGDQTCREQHGEVAKAITDTAREFAARAIACRERAHAVGEGFPDAPTEEVEICYRAEIAEAIAMAEVETN